MNFLRTVSSIFLVVTFGFVGFQCTVKSKGDGHFQATDKAMLPLAVHTRYLDFPVPSMGVASQFNPPVLRWPARKRESVAYDVRLSQDSMFMDNEGLGLSNSPWAMFNPHQELVHGNWFWQYRIAGGDWSDLLRFQVGDDAIVLVSPPAADFLGGIPESHPRVLAGPSGLIDPGAISRDADAEAIIREANRALKVKFPSENDGIPQGKFEDDEKNRKLEQDASQKLGDIVYGAVTPLCQAYLLTGDDRYRQKASAFAFEVSRWDPTGVSRISDFSDSRCMLSMAIVYDTFYDQLSVYERSILLRAIHARAENFYLNWINNIEVKLLSGHVWQHILHYFFQTAVAVYGEDPDAENWLAYAYELFLARAPVLGGTDGGWAEGVSYFRMNMETMVDIPLYIREYTGFDFILAHPWYAAHVDWLIYNIPPGSSSDGFGDNAEEVSSPGIPYVAFAGEMAKLMGSRLASWYAKECKKYEDIDLAANSTLRWIRLTRTRNLHMPEPRGPEPGTGKVFRDIGLVSLHTDPQNTSENLMVAMRSSPFGSYGHLLSDQNAFNILFGGERTFFRTGYKVTMKDPHRTGWYQHTKSNNSILIDNEGQPYSCESFGVISRFIDGNELAYAKGDASRAYASLETREDHGVRKFHRNLILLKPDIIVIYDELGSATDVHWSWLIHSMRRIDVDSTDNTFSSNFNKVKGVGKLWSADRVRWVVADTFDVPAVNWRGTRHQSGKLRTYDDEQWHLKAINLVKTSNLRFLTVLKMSPNANASSFSGDMKSGVVKVTSGKWKIVANLDTNLPPSLTIVSENTAFTSHGDKVTLAGKTYPESNKGSSRLVEIFDGKLEIAESADQFPWAIQQSLRYSQENPEAINSPL